MTDSTKLAWLDYLRAIPDASHTPSDLYLLACWVAEAAPGIMKFNNAATFSMTPSHGVRMKVAKVPGFDVYLGQRRASFYDGNVTLNRTVLFIRQGMSDRQFPADDRSLAIEDLDDPAELVQWLQDTSYEQLERETRIEWVDNAPTDVLHEQVVRSKDYEAQPNLPDICGWACAGGVEPGPFKTADRRVWHSVPTQFTRPVLRSSIVVGQPSRPAE